jgi:hypothetical protein
MVDQHEAHGQPSSLWLSPTALIGASGTIGL